MKLHLIGNQHAAKPAEAKADAVLHIRVKSTDLELWKQSAKGPLSRFVINSLNEKAGQ